MMMKIDHVFDLGTTIDNKYRLTARIGRGGMGDVFKACHIEIGLPVAIKTLRSEYAENEDAISRLYQEARLAGSIGHDHICQVTDIGRHQDTPYLVMPLLTGKTLSSLLEDAPLPIPRLLDIVCQVLSALAAAHRLKIVHRDLKPSNIFITKVGKQDDFVKLLDFGISKVLRPEHKTPTTQTGAVPGTTHYMTPEQAMGSRDIDHRVDIYAVGVVLYRGLTGRYPFDGKTTHEILYKITSGLLTPPRKINSAIPKRIEEIIIKAMARDPLKRFDSADEMQQALERVAGDTVATATSERAKTPTPNRATVPTIAAAQAVTPRTIALTQTVLLSKEKSPKRRHAGLSVMLLSVGLFAGTLLIGTRFFSRRRAPSDIATTTTSSMQTDLPRSTADAPQADALFTATVARPLNATESVLTSKDLLFVKERTVGDPPPKKKPPASAKTLAKKNAPTQKRKPKKRTQEDFPPESSKKRPPTKIKGPFGTEISLDFESYLIKQ